MIGTVFGAAALIFMIIAVARRQDPDKPAGHRAALACPYCDHNHHQDTCREVIDAGGWGRDAVCGCTWRQPSRDEQPGRAHEKRPPASR